MPKPHQRTRTKKRRLVKLPSASGFAIHYRKQRAKVSHCFKCGRVVHGVPTRRASEMNRVPLSRKRPQRMFGGQLCHLCLRESLKHAARSLVSA